MSGEQRAAQILEAAADVFARKGYHAATTREIAAQAGISEATIYIHFESKRDLLFTMLERVASATLDPLVHKLEDADERTFMREILRDRLSLLDANQGFARVILQEVASDEELREQLIARVVQPLLRRVVPLWEARVQAGRARPFDPRVIIPAMAGATAFAAFISAHLPRAGAQPVSRDKLIDQLVEFFLHGVGMHKACAGAGPVLAAEGDESVYNGSPAERDTRLR